MIGFLPDIQKRLRLHGLSGKIQTALVERINNTMRADLAALARKAHALARSPLHLQQLLLSWLAYYHLTRPHSSLRLPKSKQPIPNLRDRTPASAKPPCGMAAGVVDSVWSFLRFLRTPSFPELINSANFMHMAC